MAGNIAGSVGCTSQGLVRDLPGQGPVDRIPVVCLSGQWPGFLRLPVVIGLSAELFLVLFRSARPVAGDLFPSGVLVQYYF